MTMDNTHLKKLENLFLSANIQQLFPGIHIEISTEATTINWPVAESHFHGGNALHGASYFKLLDDAAYFAAAAKHDTHFLVTATYSIKFLKPIHSGLITATGIVTHSSGKRCSSESRLYNEQGELLAEGSGIFVPTTTLWTSLSGYHL